MAALFLLPLFNVFVLLVGSFANASPEAFPPGGVLKEEFKKLLDNATNKLNTAFRNQGNATQVAIQFGWRDAEQHFGIASGMIFDGNSTKMRKATPADTVLFGSGTKTYVAAAIMRLIDAGKIKGTDAAGKHIDPWLQKYNGTTLEGLFGPDIAKATVLDLIRMAAGIPGFEVAGNTIDADAMEYPDRVWSAFEWIRSTTTYCNKTNPSGCLSCKPGTCTRYSSTSYEVAGLLVAAMTNANDWTGLDLRAAVFADADSYPSLQFPSASPDHLAAYLTTTGTSINPQWGEFKIYEQNPSVLGWTCGNMVGTVSDEASFLYDLLDSDSPNANKIVSEASLAEMKRMEYLTQGWQANATRYGAGLMTQNISYNASWRVQGPEDWGWAIGHGGETYGFSSCNGYIPKLKAAYSIALNVDIDQGCAIIQCQIMEVAADLLRGEPAYLNCSSLPDHPKPGPPHGPGGGPGPHWHPHGPPPSLPAPHNRVEEAHPSVVIV